MRFLLYGRALSVGLMRLSLCFSFLLILKRRAIPQLELRDAGSSLDPYI